MMVMIGMEFRADGRNTGAGEAVREERNMAEIVIVGGGASGLSTAGALKKIGLDSTVLEKDSMIGGTWARRYDRLHLHTIRQFSGLAYMPIPKRYPRYVPRDGFVRYLQDYARRMRLNVVTGCEVKKVTPLEAREQEQAGGYLWRVETTRGDWLSKVVVLATGQYSIPKLPEWPGLAEFRGKVIHSSEYRNGREWVGKRTLVVGVGNSGAEIATDLAEAGAGYSAIAIRTAPFLTRRQTFGVPVQVLSLIMSKLPPKVADKVAQGVTRVAFGDMRRLGIKRAGYSPYEDQRVPLIDVGFADAVKAGKVIVKPDVVGFTATGVRFGDGQEEAFDLVVAATGYSSGLERLLPVEGMLTEKGYPLFSSGAPTSRAGLFFMGFTHSLRGHLFEANRASRRLARHVAMFLRGGKS